MTKMPKDLSSCVGIEWSRNAIQFLWAEEKQLFMPIHRANMDLKIQDFDFIYNQTRQDMKESS